MRFPAACVLLLAWSSCVLAHHGNSEFDLRKQVKYEGTLTKILWKNPHILLTLDTHAADGEAISLDIEAASPSVLRVGGFSSASLVAGERVTALVSPNKRRPKQSAYGFEITKADGSVVPLVSGRMQRVQTSQSTTTIYGTWVPTSDSFTHLVRSLHSWPLTARGKAKYSAFTLAESGQVHCIPVAAPMLMTYPVVTVFEPADDHIDIKTEWLGARRIVYTDGRAHPGADARFKQGHSTGHWEGNVLVVDTTNFTDQETGGIPSGARRHLVERFTLGADGKSLAYDYVLEDPDYLADRISGHGEYSYRPDLQLTGADCDQALANRYLEELKQ